MGEPPKCAYWVGLPRGMGESAPLNSYGNQSYSIKTEGGGNFTTPPLSEGYNAMIIGHTCVEKLEYAYLYWSYLSRYQQNRKMNAWIIFILYMRRPILYCHAWLCVHVFIELSTQWPATHIAEKQKHIYKQLIEENLSMLVGMLMAPRRQQTEII